MVQLEAQLRVVMFGVERGELKALQPLVAQPEAQLHVVMFGVRSRKLKELPPLVVQPNAQLPVMPEVGNLTVWGSVRFAFARSKKSGLTVWSRFDGL